MKTAEPEKAQSFFCPSVEAEASAEISGVSHSIFSSGPMVVEKVEAPEAVSTLADSVEHVFVEDPLARVGVEKTKGDTNHESPQLMTGLSHMTSMSCFQMLYRLYIDKTTKSGVLVCLILFVFV